MAQFDVCRNTHPTTRDIFPLLLDVQSELLEDLRTRVVIPLTQSQTLSRAPMATLTPAIRVNGERYILVTPALAGIAKTQLGPRIAAVPEDRETIVAAMDLLITGD